MAAIKTLCIILLLVLPLFASACQVSVSQKLTKGKSSKTSTYSVTIRNVGSIKAANIVLQADNELNSVTGMKPVVNCDADGNPLPGTENTYELPASIQLKGGVPSRASYTFTYTITKGESASFTSTCADELAPIKETSAPTKKPSSSSSTKSPTSKPATSSPTTQKAATTKPATGAPTQRAATTKPATGAPTQRAATTKPAATTTTKAPSTTKAATKAPTAPTAVPNNAGGGSTTSPATAYKKCPAGTWWQPEPMTTWQWQISGTVDTSFDVQMYDIDLFGATNTLINTLHSKGKFVICYFSTQYEDWRPDAAQFPQNLIGNPLDDWEGERYVDSRSPVIRTLMAARMALAASKGCDGVEPDNVDSYSANNGFKLTTADGLDYNKWMASTAHSYGLSVGLKNDLSQITSLVNYFDWALNEQCAEYGECADLAPFVAAGKAVFSTEYTGSSASVCPKMNTQKISALFKSLNLDAPIKAQCCSVAAGGCKSAPYTCGNASSKRSLSVVEEVTEDLVSNFNVDELDGEANPEKANSAATAVISASVLIAAVFAAML